MPRNWSTAVRACKRHPSGVVRPDGTKRACGCKGIGWRYRLALPDPITGKRGKPSWSPTFPTKDAADGLRWADVDTEAHLIRIEQELIDVKGEHECPYCGAAHKRLLFDTPKSSAGERVWPLVPQVEAAFLAHRLRQDSEREAYGNDYADHDLVFARPDGTPWRPDWVSREFKRLFRVSGAAAGMPKAPSLKALRSTSMTALHEAGVALEVIQRVGGHVPGSNVTRDHYLAVSAERTRTEFEVIAARRAGSDRPGRSDRLSDHHPETSGTHPRGGDAS